jgi:hypothetical protein
LNMSWGYPTFASQVLFEVKTFSQTLWCRDPSVAIQRQVQYSTLLRVPIGMYGCSRNRKQSREVWVCRSCPAVRWQQERK